jgi:2-dehydro-3-deoxygluconokinase
VSAASGIDVVAMGEVLVELRSDAPVRDATEYHRSFSGDALNAAAAAAAAGARTALFTAVGEDDLGDSIVAYLQGLGIDTRWVVRVARPNGLYLLRPDVNGEREFHYWREGSAASGIGPADVEAARSLFERAGGIVVSGITAALSDSARAAMLSAMRVVREHGGRVVYDPNFRRKLTSPEAARETLSAVAPLADLVIPSCPADSRPVLGCADALTTAERVLDAGAGAVIVTRGTVDAVVATRAGRSSIRVPVNPEAVDATGAGDILAGTVTARLVLGDELDSAARLGVAAASLSVSGLGGAGYVPPLPQTRALAGVPF